MNSPKEASTFGTTRLPLGGILWVMFFCYATITALLAQKLLIPLIPSLHAGLGLMKNDAFLYHSYAVTMAGEINAHGWSAWSLFGSEPGFGGNVAILAALYALFGVDPSLMVPITAAAHASGGVLIYLLGRTLWQGHVGKYGGVVAALLFIGFPSALTWYSQPFKDGFSIVGVLLILYCWVWALDRSPTLDTTMRLALGVTGGAVLLFVFKPYLLILVFVASLLMLFVMLLMQIVTATRRSWKLLLCFVPALLLLTSGASMSKNVPSVSSLMHLAQQGQQGFRWIKSDWTPDVVERAAARAALHRSAFIDLNRNVNAGSAIDLEIRPDTITQVAGYLPRALQIALFAPFPSSWLEKLSVMRLAGIAETLLWYLVLPGIVLAVMRKQGRSLKIVLSVGYALFFLTILGFVNPNVGTLYRMRYAYLFILLLIGVLGWTSWFLDKRRSHQRPPSDRPADMSRTAIVVSEEGADNTLSLLSRKSVALSGMLVALLTLVSGFGFFLRDLLMARQFGLGNELDAFFIAMMTPMFFVAVFSTPLGAAITQVFFSVQKRFPAATIQVLVNKISLLAVLGSLVTSILLYLVLPTLLPHLAAGFDTLKLQRTITLSYWVLPLVVMSGLIIMGNALLNSMQNFALPAWAQAVVPVVAIATLLIFGNSWGVVAVAVGMLLGQLLNLVIVASALARRGLSLRPQWRGSKLHGGLLRNFFSQYSLLVVAAFFVALAVPVGNIIASNLPSGSVAALNFGNKIVLFITGLTSTAIATVILPHFSAYMAKNRMLEARRELSFFLLTGTVLSVLVCLFCFALARTLAGLVLGNTIISEDEIETVARIIELGIIQLPVFTCSILLLRFAIASHQSLKIMLLSFIGLLLNIGLSLFFVKFIGVAGIPLASTLALSVSTFFLLMILHRIGDIPWIEVMMIGLCWALFFTLILCLHYHSYPGSVIAGFGMVLLLVEYGYEVTGRTRISGQVMLK